MIIDDINKLIYEIAQLVPGAVGAANVYRNISIGNTINPLRWGEHYRSYMNGKLLGNAATIAAPLMVNKLRKPQIPQQ